MPVLKPVPILTHGKSVWRKIWIWLTQPRKWIFDQDFPFVLPNGTEVVIPRGFMMDGASVPRLFWFFLSPTGLLLIAGAIHDYGYRYDRLLIRFKGNLVPYRVGSGKAWWDKLFYEINLAVNGVWIASFIAYWAVKLFGHSAWRSHRK